MTTEANEQETTEIIATSKKRAASEDAPIASFDLDAFIRNDSRIGYPRTKPNLPPFKHGWFFPSHIEMIELISSKVKIGK